LYEKGIIKYIPESGSAYDYKSYDQYDYKPNEDIVFNLKYPNFIMEFGGNYDFEWNNNLNESLNENYGEFEPKMGILYLGNNKYNYSVDKDANIEFYKIVDNELCEHMFYDTKFLNNSLDKSIM